MATAPTTRMARGDKFERWKREIEARIEEERQAVAAAIGIDRDFRPVALVYNQRTGIIIASVEADGFAGDWLSIDRFDLELETAESVVTKGGLQLPEPYADGWVSELLGVLADDSAIICSCGLMEPRRTGANESQAHYWLCTVQPRSQKVTLLSRLEGIWF